jgi:hypothetical protein
MLKSTLQFLQQADTKMLGGKMIESAAMTIELIWTSGIQIEVLTMIEKENIPSMSEIAQNTNVSDIC